MGTSNLGRNYEQATASFYSKFTDYKELNKFNKSKDKENWLTKNFKKTGFTSATEAVSSYSNMIAIQAGINKASNDVQEIRNELLKKYDTNLIWDTLQTRIKARK